MHCRLFPCVVALFGLYFQKIILSHPQAIKALGSGRVVVVDTEKHRNTLGIVLQTGPATVKTRTFTTLVLSEQKSNIENGPHGDVSSSESNKEDLTLPRPVTENKLFQPEGPCAHGMLELTADNISVITVKTLKVAGDKIVEECKKRQIPRFRYQLSLDNYITLINNVICKDLYTWVIFAEGLGYCATNFPPLSHSVKTYLLSNILVTRTLFSLPIGMIHPDRIQAWPPKIYYVLLRLIPQDYLA